MQKKFMDAENVKYLWNKLKTRVSEGLEEEKQARIDADDVLQTNIDTESTTRGEADTTLQTNIDTEATAREDKDTDLQEQIDDIKAFTDEEMEALLSDEEEEVDG